MASVHAIGGLTHRLREHHAVKAWNRLQSERAVPDSIQTLKRARLKSWVYRLNGIRRNGAPVIAKKCPRESASVERIVYEELLPRVPVPALRCHGYLEEPEGDFCWIFLEDAAGERFAPELARHRAMAGRWLGELHLTLFPAELTERLCLRDLRHSRQLLRDCRATLLYHLELNPALTARDRAVLRRYVAHCDTLESHWSRIEMICGVLPRTVVHGDFADKNMRIRHGAHGPALLVYDWEFAGWGTPAADLAQCAHHVTRPDLLAYLSVLKRLHPGLSLRDILGVAACGNLLRMVNEIDWARTGMEIGCRDSLLRPVETLRVYDARLTGALRAFERELA